MNLQHLHYFCAACKYKNISKAARETHVSQPTISMAIHELEQMVFWDQIFNEIGKEYSDVKTQSYLVDAASMLMIKDPGRFEIVVTSNLFGDIYLGLFVTIPIGNVIYKAMNKAKKGVN